MKKLSLPTIKLLGIAFGMLLAAILFVGQPYWTHGTDRVTVTGTTVKTYDGHSKFLVFTSEGTFENTDTWWFLKFNSADIQGKLMQGGTFDLSHTGWRVPFFSKFPNITDVAKAQ